MGFEVFDRRSAARGGPPWITLQARGNFSLNEGAARMIAGESGKACDGLPVELLFDRDLNGGTIGIRHAPAAPNPYRLRKQANSSVYMLAGKAFTEHFGIDTTQARRYAARKVHDGIVGFSLGDRSTQVGRSSGDSDPEDSADSESAE